MLNTATQSLDSLVAYLKPFHWHPLKKIVLYFPEDFRTCLSFLVCNFGLDGQGFVHFYNLRQQSLVGCIVVPRWPHELSFLLQGAGRKTQHRNNFCSFSTYIFINIFFQLVIICSKIIVSVNIFMKVNISVSYLSWSSNPHIMHLLGKLVISISYWSKFFFPNFVWSSSAICSLVSPLPYNKHIINTFFHHLVN